MKEELWKTVKLFLLWCLLFSVAIIGIIVWKRVLKNDEIMNWTVLLGYLLITIVFFGKGYVKLSFGCIERRMIWLVIGTLNKRHQSRNNFTVFHSSSFIIFALSPF